MKIKNKESPIPQEWGTPPYATVDPRNSLNLSNEKGS
jgi:hypothetical protein